MSWFDNAVATVARGATALGTMGASELERTRGSNSIERGFENGVRGATSGLKEMLTGERATQRAIDAQTGAAAEANATQKYIYDQNRQDAQPWRDVGLRALPQLENPEFQRDFTMGDFQADPGYAFRLAEGQKALERSAAARGGLNSGATMKGLSKYNQDMASQEYQNAYNRFNANADRRFNRLSALAGVGQTATGQAMQSGESYGNQVSANQIGMGNAIASANIAQANRNSNLVGQGLTLGGLIFSDERLKTNIKQILPDELAEMRVQLKPYRFNYKSPDHGEGDWVGVMAQDLEKSKLGRTLVVEDENGNKQIDLKKAVSLLLAMVSEGYYAG